jgi:hypothetical protein
VILKNAFKEAQLVVNCGGGGTSQLFVVVGHRPVVIGNHETIVTRIKRRLISIVRYVTGDRATFIFGLFVFALVVSIVAQIVNYQSGPRTNPRLLGLVLGSAAAILLGVAGRLGMQDLRQFFEYIDAVYVLPRKVTSAQAAKLREYSARHKKFPVTVKSSGQDREATEYAAELRNALSDAGWAATFDTSGEEYYGLCVCATGENARPADDPRDFLATALRAADIVQFSMGGVTAGASYKLFLLVGRRPVALY